MTNLDALLGAPPTGGQSLCIIGKHLAELSAPYNTALQEMLTSSLASLMVANRLKAAGLGGSEKAVQRHRRLVCGCPEGGVA
jgi:hypothetical protein